MIRTEQEIRHEIEELSCYVERFSGDDSMKAWFEGQLKALLWVLGLPHLEAYLKSIKKEAANAG